MLYIESDPKLSLKYNHILSELFFPIFQTFTVYKERRMNLTAQANILDIKTTLKLLSLHNFCIVWSTT